MKTSAKGRLFHAVGQGGVVGFPAIFPIVSLSIRQNMCRTWLQCVKEGHESWGNITRLCQGRRRPGWRVGKAWGRLGKTETTNKVIYYPVLCYQWRWVVCVQAEGQSSLAAWDRFLKTFHLFWDRDNRRKSANHPH